MQDNNQLRSLIKLRHLKKASQNNWEMLRNSQMMVDGIVSEAKQFMENYGSTTGKSQFILESNSLSTNIGEVQKSLDDFYLFITGTSTIDLENSFQKFTDTLDSTTLLFDTISSYPTTHFERDVSTEWKEIWSLIQSNMSIVRGVGESAYIKSLMIVNFNNSEVDTLTSEIAKHIPESFNLLEADKYKQEYVQAVKEIEQESNAKENLWDRFLNVLAGAVPLKQTPEERVMMRRWLDGEKGELQ